MTAPLARIAALALATTAWAQAPRWTDAEIADASARLEKLGAPADLAETLAAKARESADSRSIVVGHWEAIAAKAGGWALAGVCIERLEGPKHAAARKRAAELRAKNRVLTDAFPHPHL